MHIAHRTCALEQMRSEGWIVLRGEERDPFFALERLLRFKLFDQAHRVVRAHFRYASFVRHQASDYTPPKDDKLPGRSTPFMKRVRHEVPRFPVRASASQTRSCVAASLGFYY